MKKEICVVSNDWASRECNCQCCGKPIAKGVAHKKVSTPKRKTGYHLHNNCMGDFSRRAWDCENNLNTESNSDSYTCRNHKVVVYGSVNDLMYFKGENDMHGKKMNKTVARYQTSWKKNRQSIGAVLSTCFKNNLRVFVIFDENKKMIEVFSKSEYTDLTNINK